MELVMFVKIFDNYHAGVSMLPEPEQDAFYGAVIRYAFEGREPEFEGISAAIWMTIKDFIDKSIQGQGNGSKGGNGRGNKNPDKDDTETRSETQSKKGSGKRGCKTPSENQKKRIERNGKENPEGFFSNSADASDGAALADATPPAALECPTCAVPMERTNSHRGDSYYYRCPMCAEEVLA